MPSRIPIDAVLPSAASTRAPTDVRGDWCDASVTFSLVVIAALVVGATPVVVPTVLIAVATPVLWHIDVTQRRLPNGIVAPLGLAAAVAVAATAWFDGSWPVGALLATAATAAFFGLLSIGGGMGMGDVKLATVLAAVLGLVRVDAVVAAALVAFSAGGVAGVIVHVRSRATSIPFGPFLLIGFWAALVLSR